jgi:hypothetical protein
MATPLSNKNLCHSGRLITLLYDSLQLLYHRRGKQGCRDHFKHTLMRQFMLDKLIKLFHWYYKIINMYIQRLNFSYFACIYLLFRLVTKSSVNPKWRHVSTSFKIYLEMLSHFYITFTIFYYNTISLKGKHNSVLVKGLYQTECMIDRQYSSYCFLASELSIEKKIKYSRQTAYSQSMGFAINISHAQ